MTRISLSNLELVSCKIRSVRSHRLSLPNGLSHKCSVRLLPSTVTIVCKHAARNGEQCEAVVNMLRSQQRKQRSLSVTASGRRTRSWPCDRRSLRATGRTASHPRCGLRLNEK